MDTLLPLLGWLGLASALLITPWLLARLVIPHGDGITTTAGAGVIAVILNTGVPIGLHLAALPITAVTLATPHLVLVLIVLLMKGFFGRSLLPTPRPPLAWLGLLLLFAALTLPLTHLAGVDTYKWQGLAKSVRVEACIPWLVHPASLLGFTPRSYPSAQPLTLASIQIMGGIGVGAGYYLFSLLSGFTGISLAWVLGRRVFDVPTHVPWFALFYICAPVSMRYQHWATGRGLFLSLLPLLLLTVLRLPRGRALVALPGVLLLLALSHKVGLIAGALVLISLPALLLLPRSARRCWPLLLALPVLAAAVLLTPPFLLPSPMGQPLGLIRQAITRFGWMLPVAALGLLGARGWLAHPARRRLFPAALLTLPAAFGRDPYGALIALPFVTLVATAGLAWLRDQCLSRSWSFSRALFPLAGVATLLGALIIVGDRTRQAMPPRLWRAAMALEAIDPLGPFQVHAPGRARAQFHAYTSGCPRFLITPGATTGLILHRPPPLRGPPTEWLPQWVDFSRHLLEMREVEVDWYGVDPRDYFIIVDGEGEHPPDGGERLYDREGIEIWTPVNPTRPRAERAP